MQPTEDMHRHRIRRLNHHLEMHAGLRRVSLSDLQLHAVEIPVEMSSCPTTRAEQENSTSFRKRAESPWLVFTVLIDRYELIQITM